jgi:hypothetical protein
MKASDFDKQFNDNQADLVDALDLSSVQRPNQSLKRVNVDFPVWMVESLDREASRLGLRGSRSSRCGLQNGYSRPPQRIPDETVTAPFDSAQGARSAG